MDKGKDPGKTAAPQRLPRKSVATGASSTPNDAREGVLAVPAPSAVTHAAPAPIKAILHDAPRKQKTGKAEDKNKNSQRKPLALFSHLLQYSRNTERLGAVPHMHPSIVKFSLRSADFENIGGSRRCREMLTAFKDAIRDYRANPEMAVCRHLDLYLKPMIGYMVDARPMAVAMSNAVRALRHTISVLPVETAEYEAQGIMYDFIDRFLVNRIELADTLIVQHALSKISDGDVILTYARSVVVRDLFVAAKAAGRRFRVIVVGSRPFQEGMTLLRELVAQNVQCAFVNINAIGYMMREVTKTIVGAAGIYANGTLLSRIGTAAVCALSRRANVPVIVCCETLKFSDRSQIDSFVFNEIGDPDVLVLPKTQGREVPGVADLTDWRNIASLKLVNIVYDVTPAEFVTVVITEIGLIPVTSIPVVLREYTTNSLSLSS